MKTLNNLDIAKYLLKLEKKAYKVCSKQKIDIKDKGSHDLVTSLDTSLEKFIIKELNKNFPDIKIVSEEFNSSAKATGSYFVIDPIDGTINFANGINYLWGIQTAYIENDVTVASALYNPMVGAYYAAKGFGSYKNNKKFEVAKKDPLHSLTCLDISNFDFYQGMEKSLKDKLLKFRSNGACFTNCILMAEGCYGAYVQFDTHPWDILPGFLLIEEAGVLHEKLNGHHFFASTPETMKVLKSALKENKKFLTASKKKEEK